MGLLCAYPKEGAGGRRISVDWASNHIAVGDIDPKP